MLFAALASVVIASCYDGDTCTTTTGERVRLACIDTPELVGKRAKPMPAKAARDHLRGLVVGKQVGRRRINEERYGRNEVKSVVAVLSALQHPKQELCQERLPQAFQAALIDHYFLFQVAQLTLHFSASLHQVAIAILLLFYWKIYGWFRA